MSRKQNAKQLYEKMVDYKNYAVALLAVGAFFYLGVIIPSEGKVMKDLYMMMIASTVFLGSSIIFFYMSKKTRSTLLEMDEGEEFLSKK